MAKARNCCIDDFLDSTIHNNTSGVAQALPAILQGDDLPDISSKRLPESKRISVFCLPHFGNFTTGTG
jgi:hypothetical protein